MVAYVQIEIELTISLQNLGICVNVWAMFVHVLAPEQSGLCN